MVGILILAHGSRAAETEKTLSAVVDMVRSMLPDVLIKPAYMEFGSVNIEGGIDSLLNEGAGEIKIIPYFLFEGIHIKEDIPEEIEKCRKRYPNIKIEMGKTLGADFRLAQILKDRIEEIV